MLSLENHSKTKNTVPFDDRLVRPFTGLGARSWFGDYAPMYVACVSKDRVDECMADMNQRTAFLAFDNMVVSFSPGGNMI